MQLGSSACVKQTVQVIIPKPSSRNLELAPTSIGSAEERLGEQLTNSELHWTLTSASSLVEIFYVLIQR